MKSEYLDCYLRVSTTSQGHSLKSQQSIGKRVSKILGLKFRVHNEGTTSSVKRDSKDRLVDRKVLSQIKEDIEDKKITNLWVVERERLFRDSTESGFFRKNYLSSYDMSINSIH